MLLVALAAALVVAGTDLQGPGWDVPVAGVYTDCAGAAPVPAGWAAWEWTCAGSNNLYLLGHNPGAFAQIESLRPGDPLVLNGQVYWVEWSRAVSADDWSVTGGLPYPSLTLQTCDGQGRWVVRAYEGFPRIN
jgi:hypothetical protein